jgi:hypothetical protein
MGRACSTIGRRGIHIDIGAKARRKETTGKANT